MVEFIKHAADMSQLLRMHWLFKREPSSVTFASRYLSMRMMLRAEALHISLARCGAQVQPSCGAKSLEADAKFLLTLSQW